MQNKTILLVDDEQDIRRVAELSLTRIGNYSVILASSGEEALKILNNEKPDIILLDVMMPGMDGLSVLNSIKSDSTINEIPVVFITAKVQAHEKQQFINNGAVGIIEKPFDPIALSEQVGAYLN